jgi:cyanophycin synthetase
VVTNISADHLGDDGIDSLDDLIGVKALVAEEIRDGASVVLNADDPATVALAERRAVRAHSPVIRYFSMTAGNAVLARHKASGGACYEVIDGQLTETKAGSSRPVLAVADLPGAFGGRAPHVVANALAAAAACRGLGVSVKDIGRALATFAPAEQNAGRGSIFRAGDSPVIVDYGHNAAALQVTGQFVADVFGPARGRIGNTSSSTGGRDHGQRAPVAAVTLPGDRRDDLLMQTATAIAAWFGKVVLYEDSDKRGRPAGEMLNMLTSALLSARPEIECAHAENPTDALRAALNLAKGGPVLFLYEKLTMAQEALTAVGAKPWPDAERSACQASTAVQAGAVRAGAAQAVVADAAAVAASAAEATARPAAADASADYGWITG